MRVQDECRPHFEAIKRALARKSDNPRARQALDSLQQAQIATELVDAREAYLKEARTPQPGTICVYIEGDKNRPVRVTVLGVDVFQKVRVSWFMVGCKEKVFSSLTGQCITPSRHEDRASDTLDPGELKALLASLPRPAG